MKDKGDKTSRRGGSNDIAKGLSHQQKITETPESLGMGRNETSGKPKGPQKGSMGGQRVA